MKIKLNKKQILVDSLFLIVVVCVLIIIYFPEDLLEVLSFLCIFLIFSYYIYGNWIIWGKDD